MAVATTGTTDTGVGAEAVEGDELVDAVVAAVGSPVELSVEPQAARVTQAAPATSMVALRFHRLPNIGGPPSSGRLPDAVLSTTPVSSIWTFDGPTRSHPLHIDVPFCVHATGWTSPD
ncbi:MAG: hypothetical protein ABWZ98_01345 [Nakamurella sp.]